MNPSSSALEGTENEMKLFQKNDNKIVYYTFSIDRLLDTPEQVRFVCVCVESTLSR